jgi:hypothetical protein
VKAAVGVTHLVTRRPAATPTVDPQPKTLRVCGRWDSIDDAEIAVAEWVEWVEWYTPAVCTAASATSHCCAEHQL